MMINSQYKRISAPTVIANLDVLGTFVIGDKPVTDGDRLLKDERVFQTFQRKFVMGFEPQVIANTFWSAKNICEKAVEPYHHSNKEGLLSDADKIRKFVISSFEGLKTVEATYRKEAETALYKQNKIDTANKLKEIYDSFCNSFPQQDSSGTIFKIKENPVASSSKQVSHASTRFFAKKKERKEESSAAGVAPKTAIILRPMKKKVASITPLQENHKAAEKKKEKPYVERSSIRTLVHTQKKDKKNIIEGIKAFSTTRPVLAEEYALFDDTQKEKKQAASTKTNYFDPLMLSRAAKKEKPMPNEGSNHSWDNSDEASPILQKKWEQMHPKENRPLIERSISLYPLPPLQGKPSFEGYFIKKLKIRRAQTENSYSDNSQCEEDDFFDSEET